MTKIGTTAVVALCAASTILPPQPAQAFDPPYVWAGRAVITKITTKCEERTILKVGEEFDSAFRPRLQGGEEPTGISFLLENRAHIYRSTENNLRGLPDGKFEAVIVNRKANFNNKRKTGSYSINVINPWSGKSGFTEDSEHLEIDPIIIRGWGGKAGCDVTFRGAYTLQGRLQ